MLTPQTAYLDSRDHSWARGNSAHDRFVSNAKRFFPGLTGALAAIMLMLPLVHNREMSFILSKEEVAIAKQRLRITDAEYRGRDEYGRSFVLTAGSAVQTTSKDPYVTLKNLTARINLTQGPASIHAAGGQYNIGTESVSFNGPIMLNAADGYHMTARGVVLDLKNRQLTSSAGVDGHIPLGDFSAQQLHADVESHTVTLDGKVHLHILQSGSKGPKL